MKWIVDHWVTKSHGVDQRVGHGIEHLHGLHLHHGWIVEHFLKDLASIFEELQLPFEISNLCIFILIAFGRLVFNRAFGKVNSTVACTRYNVRAGGVAAIR